MKDSNYIRWQDGNMEELEFKFNEIYLVDSLEAIEVIRLWENFLEVEYDKYLKA